MKSSREQFDEWFKSEHEEVENSQELSAKVMKMISWSAWQASRAAIEVELSSKENPANLFCEVYSCDMVHESLANCGLKVKS